MLLHLVSLETAPDPAAWLVNYGVAGIVIALLALGRFRTKQEVDGLREQLQMAQEAVLAERTANAALMQQITNHTLPQISHLADVLDRLPVVPPGGMGPDNTAVMERISATLARLDERTKGDA